MKRNQIILHACFCLGLVSCERVRYFPDRPIVVPSTYLLSHKGGGTFDGGNTLPACKYGFTKLDGIECDIERSADNTIWLDHSSMIPACGSIPENCFASSTDHDIVTVDSCLGSATNFARLEDVFGYMSNNYPNKFISLDVKAWTPCKITDANVTRQMNEMAQKIIDLMEKYKLHDKIMVESEAGDFLYYVKTHTKHIETYLTAFGDFDLGVSRALNAGFSGISFKYHFRDSLSIDDVELLHRKGLKIQLWTFDTQEDIEEALSLKPDFIQTDLVDYYGENHR